jgi:hypothetical protein
MHYFRNIYCVLVDYHVLQIKCIKLFEFETNQVVCLSPITRNKVMEFVKAESDYGFAVRRRSSKIPVDEKNLSRVPKNCPDD